MNKRWLVCPVLGLALAILAPPVLAQDDRPNSLTQGAWAIQFGISNNFTLETFSGSLVSVEGQFWSSSSIRLGLGLSLGQQDYNEEFSSPDTLITRNGEGKARGMDLQLQYIRYSAPGSRTSLYWGIGPAFSYYKYDDSGTYNGEGVDLNNVSKNWSLGGRASLGVVWFPARTIGLHAEYGLNGSYRSFEYNRTISGDIEEQQDRKTDGWQVSSAGVLFGVSVYF